MSAQAKLIRNYVAEQLAAMPELGATVFAGRHRAQQTRDLPSVNVMTGSERVEGSAFIGSGARKYERRLDLQLEIRVSTNGREDDGREAMNDLDDLTERVERWMFDRETNDPIWVEALLASTQTGIPEESSEPSPMRIVTFDVLYFDYAPKAGEEPAGPLETIHVDHDLAPADGAVDATDRIAVQQP